MGASEDGAEIMTLFTPPPVKCAEAFAVVVKTSVDSMMYSAPLSRQGIEAGFFLRGTLWVSCLLPKSWSRGRW